MNDIINPIKIKDLLVIREPKLSELVKKLSDDASYMGVNFLDIPVNVYIFECMGSDAPYMATYFLSIHSCIKFFRELYDKKIYDLSLEGYLRNIKLPNDIFHYIFINTNSIFNIIDNGDAYDEFLFYQTSYSLNMSMMMYNSFNEAFVEYLKEYIPKSALMLNNVKYMPYLQYIYDNIYDIYVELSYDYYGLNDY